MNNLVKSGYLLLIVGMLSGCTGGNKVFGSKPELSSGKRGIATGREIITAFDGGILPGDVYQKLSSKDQIRALLAEYQALENFATGQKNSWLSSNGEISGVVTPLQPYQVGKQNCRQYIHKLVVNGRIIESSGAACRTLDGRWIPL